ncbi:hypothetical protein [Pseudomonas sp. RIT-PI-S]|uniref:hypothetical protein n=1 Tax=Pseudomonas sp. RIT-PI-S TaxID=3035295 RepID=UPI0021D990D4|nr:hypothetical protein [Pseudomonas sp. RIT-PI-S]
MTSANDDGLTHFQRLDPSQIDVVLGSARSARPAPPAREGRGTVWLLAVVAIAIAGWGLSNRGGAGDVAAVAATNPPTPVVTEPEVRPVAVVNTAVANQVVNQATVVIINAPARAGSPKAAAPTEQAAPPTTPQGLVSAQYLAQFKAGANRPAATAPRQVQIASVTIREWDGPNRYVARWRIEDNEIDQNSVCFNFPDDSIEHRECRRAAQQYFRDQCKDWTRRAEKAHDRETRDARSQFCAVAQGFAP